MQLKLLIITICISAALARVSQQGKHANLHREKLRDTKEVFYLGAINNKEFYISLDLSTQEQARSGCAAEGLNLAKLELQDELNFIYDYTFPEEDLAWTGGSAHFGHSAFVFEDLSEINPAVEIVGGNDYDSAFGLVINREFPNTNLRVNPSDTLRFYLCYRQY